MDYSLNFLKHGSSDVDWCETNYTVVSFIAEFFNTVKLFLFKLSMRITIRIGRNFIYFKVSNILFFIFPPILMVLFRNYGNIITRGIHLMWIFLILVGAGSVYFHATLSLAGQLMDELLILWVLMAGYAIMTPQTLLPLYFRVHRSIYFTVCLTIGIFLTLVSTYNPVYNAFFLFLIGFPAVGLLFRVFNTNTEKSVSQLTRRTIIILFLAIALWICDKVFCGFFRHLNIPYLHAIFHVLILISSYSTVVIFAYFVAFYQYPTTKPTLRYWPHTRTNSFDFFKIPYVFVSENSERKTIFQKYA
jgi:alkaline ceramidase